MVEIPPAPPPLEPETSGDEDKSLLAKLEPKKAYSAVLALCLFRRKMAFSSLRQDTLCGSYRLWGLGVKKLSDANLHYVNACCV